MWKFLDVQLVNCPVQVDMICLNIINERSKLFKKYSKELFDNLFVYFFE